MQLFGTSAFSSYWAQEQLKNSKILGRADNNKYKIYLVNGAKALNRNMDFLQWFKGKVILFDVDENLVKFNCHIVHNLDQIKQKIPEWEGSQNIDLVQQQINTAVKGSFLSVFNKVLYKPTLDMEKRSEFQAIVLKYLFKNRNYSKLCTSLQPFTPKRGKGVKQFKDLLGILQNKNLLQVCREASHNKWDNVNKLCTKYGLKVFEIHYLSKIWEIQKRTI